jgi:hypothetical protein
VTCAELDHAVFHCREFRCRGVDASLAIILDWDVDGTVATQAIPTRFRRGPSVIQPAARNGNRDDDRDEECKNDRHDDFPPTQIATVRPTRDTRQWSIRGQRRERPCEHRGHTCYDPPGKSRRVVTSDRNARANKSVASGIAAGKWHERGGHTRHGPPHIPVRDGSRPDESLGSPDSIVRSPRHEFNGHD